MPPRRAFVAAFRLDRFEARAAERSVAITGLMLLRARARRAVLPRRVVAREARAAGRVARVARAAERLARVAERVARIADRLARFAERVARAADRLARVAARLAVVRFVARVARWAETSVETPASVDAAKLGARLAAPRRPAASAASASLRI